MEAMDKLKVEITRLLEAKENRRHALAGLSFPEKVHAVVKGQEMAAPVLRARGKPVQPWRLEDEGGF
jgi:hypothetical protein